MIMGKAEKWIRIAIAVLSAILGGIGGATI